MARITFVKSAKQRYRMVPVTNEDGTQRVTPVLRKDGAPKLTKHGREITMRVTVADKSQPLPPLTCDKCREEIPVGSPYKHISPRSGPYGGRKLIRCDKCPTWNVWDYSSSLSARLAEVSSNFNDVMGDVSDPEDVRGALGEAAEAVREIAGEKEESASNIVDGFGHETSMSEELTEVADQLNSWADEIDNADVPELPDPDAVECESCGGLGKKEGSDSEDCPDCDGEGEIVPEEPTDDQMEAWRSEVDDVCAIVDESPV